MDDIQKSPLVWVLLAVLPALAQRPVINPQGVVNGASFASDPDRGLVVAYGSIATIFGSNLATSVQQATATPLPTNLAGTSVTVNGIPAPLFYVSPGQINLQFPVGGPVVVTTAAGASDPVVVMGVDDAPGIFTQSGGGCGPGAVQNVSADGSVNLNTPTQSTSPGDFISVYATGLGPVYSPPPFGWPAGSTSVFKYSTNAHLGLVGFKTWYGSVPYAGGLAPGLVGVDQVNVRIPDDAPEGCAVPLVIQQGNAASQPVTMSIRRGGGQCQDPPAARFASIHWRKTQSANSATETFTASFATAPQNLVVPPAPLAPGVCSFYLSTIHPGPRCTGSEPKGMDAGPLTIQGVSGGPITVRPSASSGQLAYTASLPAGSIQTGPLSVAAAGGADVGAFQTAIALPSPMQITTPLSPGTTFSMGDPFRVSWAGGSADAIVRMQVIHTYPDGSAQYDECAALASDGSVTLPLEPVGPHFERYLPIQPGDDNRVVIIVSPRQAAAFSAPGLTQPGTQDWTYEYHFTGLKFAWPPPPPPSITSFTVNWVTPATVQAGASAVPFAIIGSNFGPVEPTLDFGSSGITVDSMGYYTLSDGYSEIRGLLSVPKTATPGSYTVILTASWTLYVLSTTTTITVTK